MLNTPACCVTWSPRLLSMLRIAVALLFMFHGSQKLFNWPPSEHGAATLMSLMGVAGVLEFFGGLLVLVGLFTRPVAFVLSGMMAVAYFMAHANQGLLPIVNRGELALLYSFTFLYLSAAGGGPWSVDECCRKEKTTIATGADR